VQRPPAAGRTVVVVAAYSSVQYYSSVRHLENVRGLNTPHQGAQATRENTHGRHATHAGHDHRRKEEMWQGVLSNISSWAAGAVDENWREPTNRDGIHQTSKSVDL